MELSKTMGKDLTESRAVATQDSVQQMRSLHDLALANYRLVQEVRDYYLHIYNTRGGMNAYPDVPGTAPLDYTLNQLDGVALQLRETIVGFTEVAPPAEPEAKPDIEITNVASRRLI